MSRFASGLSSLALILSATLVLGMTGFILYEMILRTFFDRSTFFTEEIVGYMVAGMTFLGLGAAFRDGVIIRVGVLQALTQDKPKAALRVELVCCACALAITGTACWAFGRSVVDKYAFGYTSGTIADVPIWIPQSILLAGLGVFLLQLLAYTLDLIAGAAQPGLGAGEHSPD